VVRERVLAMRSYSWLTHSPSLVPPPPFPPPAAQCIGLAASCILGGMSLDEDASAEAQWREHLRGRSQELGAMQKQWHGCFLWANSSAPPSLAEAACRTAYFRAGSAPPSVPDIAVDVWEWRAVFLPMVPLAGAVVAAAVLLASKLRTLENAAVPFWSLVDGHEFLGGPRPATQPARDEGLIVLTRRWMGAEAPPGERGQGCEGMGRCEKCQLLQEQFRPSWLLSTPAACEALEHPAMGASLKPYHRAEIGWVGAATQWRCADGRHGPMPMESHEASFNNLAVVAAVALSAALLLVRTEAREGARRSAAFALVAPVYRPADVDTVHPAVYTYRAADVTAWAVSLSVTERLSVAASCSNMAAAVQAQSNRALHIAGQSKLSFDAHCIGLLAVFAPFYFLPAASLLIALLCSGFRRAVARARSWISRDTPLHRCPSIGKIFVRIVPLAFVFAASAAPAAAIDGWTDAGPEQMSRAMIPAFIVLLAIVLAQYVAGCMWLLDQRTARRHGVASTRKDWWDVCDFIGWYSALHIACASIFLLLLKASEPRTSGISSSYPSWTTLLCLLHPGGWLVGQLTYWLVCMFERVARNHAPRLHQCLFALIGL